MTEIINSQANYFNNNGKSAANACVRLRILVKSCSSARPTGELRARSLAAHRRPPARRPLPTAFGQIGTCRSLSCAGQPVARPPGSRSQPLAFVASAFAAFVCLQTWSLIVLRSLALSAVAARESSRITTTALQRTLAMHPPFTH